MFAQTVATSWECLFCSEAALPILPVRERGKVGPRQNIAGRG